MDQGKGNISGPSELVAKLHWVRHVHQKLRMISCSVNQAM